MGSLETLEENLIGQHVGNYVIEATLKRGGMGAVYVARHPALGRVAAVKFLSASISSPEMSARFLDEARITASLQHRNIINIFDFGALAGRFYYIMELLVGQDLGEEMSAGARLPLPTVIDYLGQICAGLAAAHQAGVVHRDLKPANIFVLDGHPLTIKLMDFGIAKILAAETLKTNYGQVMGTPAYMAPEQALGEVDKISAQTDIYALGVIAYEMLAGKMPFAHTAPMMQLVAHIHEAVPPLSETAPHVPAGLAAVVESCLAKDPKKRPVSAEVLGNQLIESLQAKASHSIDRSDRVLVVKQASPPRTAEPVAHPEPRKGVVKDQPLARTELSPPAQKKARETLVAGILDDDERSLLKKLLQRMRRKGDLPAFVANVGDVNVKADFNGKYSAEQLSAAILKDHSLTAKLLRVVNTTYLQRFGGKIYSVQQAIVILGFEQVRSIALSIAVFDRAKEGPNGARVSDSSIHSLVSGEIAKELCRLCHLTDTEQAMVCSMFCNLGRHLAIVYLPDHYDKALARAEQQDISLERAAELELGLSFRKLGIGVAEQWHLPPQLLEAMASPLPPETQLLGDRQRTSALAHFSNELCELVAGGLTGAQDPKLRKLLVRHANLLVIEPELIPELMANVEENFRVRYAGLLGKATSGSKFLSRLPEFSPQSKRRREREEANTFPLDPVAENQPVATSAVSLPRVGVRQKRELGAARAIHALKLGQGNTAESPVPALSQANLKALDEIRDALGDKYRRHEGWDKALTFIARHLSLPRLLALRANESATELVVSHAVGEDIKSLKTELRLQLNPSPTNQDVFSRAFHLKKDIVVSDSFSKKSSSQVPSRYFEVLGSPAFVLLACSADNHFPTLILADATDPSDLPNRSQMSGLDELKTLIAQAVA